MRGSHSLFFAGWGMHESHAPFFAAVRSPRTHLAPTPFPNKHAPKHANRKSLVLAPKEEPHSPLVFSAITSSSPAKP